MKNLWILLILALMLRGIVSAQNPVTRIEPPFWWAGMQEPALQLIIEGEGIQNFKVESRNPGVEVKGVRAGLDGYLFVDLWIPPQTKPGKLNLSFSADKKKSFSMEYELRERKPGSAQRKSFGAADAMYLLMPDRFANGDPANDNMPGMLETADRTNPDGRHGGDIAGIRNHLSYIRSLGFTALWINPLLENNMPKYSYHGYAITDFYKTDPRFGTNADYVRLVDDAHAKGLKVLMDMVFNHFGTGHRWNTRLPEADWVNIWPRFTRTNYRASVVTDPYASAYDTDRMLKGWFDVTMADFNQKNPRVARYLIQNSIWWIEYAGLDGIRMDTHPYSDPEFMVHWLDCIKKEYPDFGIVGECWLNTPAQLAFWQENSAISGKRNTKLEHLFDFPLCFAVQKAFNENDGWDQGMGRLYDLLTMDVLYPNPFKHVVFADNHDIDRISALLKTPENLKMALAFLFTTRGIPLMYYGTEVMMNRLASDGHGFIRQDFPGGWPGDSISVMKQLNLNPVHADLIDFITKVLNFRLTSLPLQQGKLTHYIPEDGIYVYFRTYGNEKVMVILNNNSEAKTLPVSRFQEDLKNFSTGNDILTHAQVILTDITLSPKSATILKLVP